MDYTKGVSVDAISFLLDRPVAYHRAFAKIGGSTDAGIFLSQAWYWSKRTTLDDGWFYKSGKEWEEETGLTRRQIDTVRRNLKKRGLLEDDVRGTPATVHYRLNKDNIYAAIEELSRLEEGMHQNAKVDAPKRQTERTKTPNKFPQKRQTLSTENTTEISTEITADNSDVSVVAAALVAQGMGATVASQLAASAPDECRLQLARLAEQKKVPNPAGWLVAAIKGKHRSGSHSEQSNGQSAPALILTPELRTQLEAELETAMPGLRANITEAEAWEAALLAYAKSRATNPSP